MKTIDKLFATGIFPGVLIIGFGEPIITLQPMNQSVSLCATASFRVTATTTNPPLSFQWRFNTIDLDGKTNFSLTFTNIHATNAGAYQVVVADMSGSITSQVAVLKVDPTFTKITTGQIVNDRGASWSCAWGDSDNDDARRCEFSDAL